MTATDYLGVLSRFARRVQSHTRSGHAAWHVPCPVCGDRPSQTQLRIWIGDDDKLHAKCYSGQCSGFSRRDWWRALLSATGTTAQEWFPGRLPRGRVRRVEIAATYDYRDEKGRLLFQCVKFKKPAEPDPRWRKCSYRRPAYGHDAPDKVKKDGKGNSWVWDGAAMDLDKLELRELAPATGTLYRLPELLAADVNQPVLLPEGEPDVETLRALGFVAVTNPHGAGGLTYQMCIPLQGRRVVLFEDNDEAGRRRCQSAAGMLLRLGADSVRVVSFEFDAKPEGYDATNYIRSCCEGCPEESHKLPAWFAANPDKAAVAKDKVIKLCLTVREYALLTADESAARRKKPLPPMRTLHQALEDDGYSPYAA